MTPMSALMTPMSLLQLGYKLAFWMEIHTGSDVAFMYHFCDKFNFIFNFKKIYSHKIQHKPCNLVKTNNSDCHLLNIYKG